jgi:hypothetical protein
MPVDEYIWYNACVLCTRYGLFVIDQQIELRCDRLVCRHGRDSLAGHRSKVRGDNRHVLVILGAERLDTIPNNRRRVAKEVRHPGANRKSGTRLDNLRSLSIHVQTTVLLPVNKSLISAKQTLKSLDASDPVLRGKTLAKLGLVVVL